MVGTSFSYISWRVLGVTHWSRFDPGTNFSRLFWKSLEYPTWVAARAGPLAMMKAVATNAVPMRFLSFISFFSFSFRLVVGFGFSVGGRLTSCQDCMGKAMKQQPIALLSRCKLPYTPSAQRLKPRATNTKPACAGCWGYPFCFL